MDNIHIEKSKQLANHFFWVLILQGILAILIAVFVIVWPPIIVPLIAAMFLWQGLLAIFLAARVRSFHNELPTLFDQVK